MKKAEIIEGNLDYSNFKSEYLSDLIVKGDILSDINFKVKGSLIVEGNVEKVKIRCYGDVKISKSFFGQDTGFIHSKGSFYAYQIINGNVRADKDIVIGDIISNSNLIAKGKIVVNGRGIVVGGNLFAKDCIEGKECGTQSIVETNVHVGFDFILKKKYEILYNSYLDIIREIKFKKSAVKNIFDLSYKFSEIDQIMKNLELLKDKKRALITLLELIELNEKLLKINENLEKLKNMISKNENAYIKFERIFPGVNLNILDKAFFVDRLIEPEKEITKSELEKWLQ